VVDPPRRLISINPATALWGLISEAWYYVALRGSLAASGSAPTGNTYVTRFGAQGALAAIAETEYISINMSDYPYREHPTARLAPVLAFRQALRRIKSPGH
jgi:hypothetical protein